MRYPTDQQTEQPTDTASYRGALSHLKMDTAEDKAEKIRYSFLLTANYQMPMYTLNAEIIDIIDRK